MLTPLAILLTIGSLIAVVTLNSLIVIPAYSQPAKPTSVASPSNLDLERPFRELGVTGSIVIYDQKNNKFYEHNPSRNSTAFFPASTFKIFNSLVALETGTIKDETAVLTWDGVQRQIPEWNRDTNLRQAYKNSTVWFYQVLARRIGHKQMQSFINQIGYGNREIGTPEKIDQFWLEGPLQITPREQIKFLQRLYSKDLPFSQPTIELVKDIMIFEKTPNYVWRGKTGWANSVNPEIGWFVGYLEQKDNAYFFATNIDLKDSDDPAARIEITRRCFKMLGLL
jgi:beta-lactamase class D